MGKGKKFRIMIENKEIYEDRWLSWFFSAALFVALALWGVAEYTVVQIENDTIGNIYKKTVSSIVVIPEIQNGDCSKDDLECLKLFYKHEISEYGSILEVRLETEAVSSNGLLTISGRDGYAFYLSNNGGEQVSAKGRFSDGQMAALANLIKKNNFFSMVTVPKDSGGNSDSNYKIVARILSANMVPGHPEVYSVSCVSSDCEKEFLEIKNKIIEFWGDAFVCLDGCDIGLQ